MGSYLPMYQARYNYLLRFVWVSGVGIVPLLTTFGEAHSHLTPPSQLDLHTFWTDQLIFYIIYLPIVHNHLKTLQFFYRSVIYVY